jgi:hypothetical protein
MTVLAKHETHVPPSEHVNTLEKLASGSLLKLPSSLFVLVAFHALGFHVVIDERNES